MSNFTADKVQPSAVFISHTGIGRAPEHDPHTTVSRCLELHPNKRIFSKDNNGAWCELVHNNSQFLRLAGISTITFRKYFASPVTTAS